jgi:hypothetical protein
MTLSFITGESRNLKISVNNGTPISTSINGNSWSNIAQKDFEIELAPGNNVVRLYSDAGWAADIDCMTLELIEPSSIENALNADDIKVDAANNKIVVTTNKPTEVTIIDMSGKLIAAPTVKGKYSIELPAGTYLVNNKKILVK